MSLVEAMRLMAEERVKEIFESRLNKPFGDVELATNYLIKMQEELNRKLKSEVYFEEYRKCINERYDEVSPETLRDFFLWEALSKKIHELNTEKEQARRVKRWWKYV